MSIVLTIEHPHILAALHDEIEAAVPALRPTVVKNPPGSPVSGTVKLARWTLSGDGATVRAEIPDDVDPEMVVAAIAAHDPESVELPTPPPSRDERLLGAVDQAKAAVEQSGVFTREQAATLAAVFDGLGQAITGDGSP